MLKWALFGVFFLLFVLSSWLERRINFGNHSDELRRYESMRNWPNVNGVILKHDAKTSQTMHGGRSETHYSILYEYTVNGKVYQSDRVAFDRTGADLLHTVGRKVIVYYNPSFPADAVLSLPHIPQEIPKWPVLTICIFTFLFVMLGRSLT